MKNSALLVHHEKGITTLTLNRSEKCNALDGPLIQLLLDAFFEAGRDDQAKVIILRGAGKNFCAGADLAWMETLNASSFELIRDDARNLASLLYRMSSFPKPIIALAQGSSVGGGLGLLLCSDLIIASTSARFCLPEVQLGLVPAVVSPYFISRLGESAARYYFLTAKRFEALEAARLGLVHQIVEPEDLGAAGVTLAQTLLHHSPAALAEAKRLIQGVVNHELSLELSEKTAEIFAKVRVSEEAREGFRAFLEKRPPRWGRLS